MAEKNEKWFWEIIEYAQSERPKLKEVLSSFEKDDLISFQEFFIDFSAELQDTPFVNNMEKSEDGVEDIAHWIVSKGKKYYESIMAEPKKVPYSVEGKSEEILYGVANEVYFSKFNETLDIY
jgi:Protein of unknown function (DUF4240)